jgi:hypothetical protein
VAERWRRFELGRIFVTSGVVATLRPMTIAALLLRHARGEWGDLLCEADRRANERALREGTRLLSCYGTTAGRVWVITEADRSATTVLLPEEY